MSDASVFEQSLKPHSWTSRKMPKPPPRCRLPSTPRLEKAVRAQGLRVNERELVQVLSLSSVTLTHTHAGQRCDYTQGGALMGMCQPLLWKNLL